MTETTIFTTPKAFAELQNRMADAILEAADESAKRFETAMRETATVFANAAHANVERSIEALSVAAKFRTRSLGLAREAMGIAAAAAK